MLRTAGGLTINQTTTFAGYYGSFYSVLDQSDGVNTEILMHCENTFDADGVTMENNLDGVPSLITFANAGTYNIQFSTVFNSTSGGGSDRNVNVYFKHNGSAIANSNTLLSIASSSPYAVASWNFVYSVAAGDTMEIAWQTGNSNIKAAHIAAFDGVPATPSIIITAQQIR